MARVTESAEAVPLAPGDEPPLFDPATLARDLGREFGVTSKESEVTYFAALGKTSAEISVLLGNSERTIHKHLQRIYAKLHLDNRKAAIVFIHEYYRSRPS